MVSSVQPKDVAIRRASVSDAAIVAKLSSLLGYPAAPVDLNSRLERLLPSPDHAVFVAEIGETVVGWIHGAERETLEMGQECEILGLVVDASARRAGAGRALVAAIESWAASRGRARVVVRSNIVRAESHPFYEALGYGRVKTQHVYRK
ncbi:MAG TPA: GNAT family N-acetyltransferase [Vicinamibacterales bacterium]|jgi:ribosomal protein S18 acetylase RimI-like enzyme